MENTKRLVRPQNKKVIAGVCAGIADYTGVDIAIIRAIFLFLALPGGFPGLIPYLILWIAMPKTNE